MNNKKNKLVEGLLKADGINPQGPTESERKAFHEMLDQRSKQKRSKPGIARQDIWRTIMTSKITKFAVAAVIVIGVLLGINPFGGSIDGTSIALADVAKAIGERKNCTFEKTLIVSSKNYSGTINAKMYYSDGYVREDRYDNNNNINKQNFVIYSEGIVLEIDHEVKVFMETVLTNEDHALNAPVGTEQIVDLILSKGEFKKLGRKTVNEVDLEGFEFYDKRTMLGRAKDKIKDINTRIWIDVSSNLPTLVEIDCVFKNGMKIKMNQYDPQWDVEYEPGFFEPEIPAGYLSIEERGLLGINTDNWPVVKIIPGMAAQKAGLEDGDIVLEVNGEGVSHIKNPVEARNQLLGKAGEKVLLTVKRGEEILTLEIIREPLPK